MSSRVPNRVAVPPPVLRPQFFCARPNGIVTALVAVDELPSHVSIRGIPRVLSANDTQGMTSLGTVNGRSQAYMVDGVPSGPMRASGGVAAANGGRVRDNDFQAAIFRILSDESIPPSQRLALHGLIQQAMSQSWAVTPNPIAVGNWTNPSTGNINGHGSSSVGAGSQKQVSCYFSYNKTRAA